MSTKMDIADPHLWAQRALPWLVNKTLGQADEQMLLDHLAGCAECRGDYEIEQRLAKRLAATPVVDYAPHGSLGKIMQRIDAELNRATDPAADSAADAAADSAADRAADSALQTQTRTPRAPRGWPRDFAFVAQAAAVAVLAVSLSWVAMRSTPPVAAEYHTLSNAVPAQQAHLQVIFTERLTTAEQRLLLQRVSGHIIDGPSAAGVFLVALAAPDQSNSATLDAAARELHAMPGVRFVAVVPASPAPR